MGDISELRGLIVVVTFMSVFVILVLMMPYQFVIGTPSSVQVTVPDYFEISNIMTYNLSETKLITLNQTIWDFSLGGHNLFVDNFHPEAYIDAIQIRHYSWWGPFIVNAHPMKWYDRVGQLISQGELNAHLLYIDKLDAHDYGEAYTVRCDHIYFSTVFGYNQTLYSSYLDAFTHEALDLWMGITWDQQATSFNAWQIVGMLLTFQAPNIHWAINSIIAIPIWVCIAYLAYVLIIKIIPFIPGG